VHINPAIRQNAVNGKIMPFPLIKYHGLEFFANLGIAVEDYTIKVIAIFHTSRNPKIWSERTND